MKNTPLFALIIVLLLVLMPLSAQAYEYDNAIVSTVDDYVNQSHPLRMGTRQTFFDIYNQSWVFWAEYGFHWYYSSSDDNSTWATPTWFMQISAGEIALRYDEARNFLHIVVGSLTGTGLYYRRGTPNANNTITFDSTKTISSSHYFEYMNINFDSNGYVYVAYGNASDSGRPYACKNSDNTTGAWVTDAGFPYNLNNTGNWALRIQIAVLENNNVHFVYRHQTTPPSTFLWAKLYCANNGTWNTKNRASNLFCGAGGHTVTYSITVVGNDTYLAYIRFDATRYFTFHNYTTLTWLKDAGGEFGLGGGSGGFDLCSDALNQRVWFLGMIAVDNDKLNITYYDVTDEIFYDQEIIDEGVTLNAQYFSGTPMVDSFGRMGLAWVQTVNPPFVLRYAWISPPLTPSPPAPPEEDEPLPDLVSMYTQLGMMILGLLLMFYAVTWGAWGIKKKGINDETIERMGYCMLIFLVGYGLLFTQLLI